MDDERENAPQEELLCNSSEWAAPLIGVAAAAPNRGSIFAVFLFITEVVAKLGAKILVQGSKKLSAAQLQDKCLGLVAQLKTRGGKWVEFLVATKPTTRRHR